MKCRRCKWDWENLANGAIYYKLGLTVCPQGLTVCLDASIVSGSGKLTHRGNQVTQQWANGRLVDPPSENSTANLWHDGRSVIRATVRGGGTGLALASWGRSLVLTLAPWLLIHALRLASGDNPISNQGKYEWTHMTLSAGLVSRQKDNKIDTHWALEAGEAGGKEVMCHRVLPKIMESANSHPKPSSTSSFVTVFKSRLCLGMLPMSPKRSISRFCELSQ